MMFMLSTARLQPICIVDFTLIQALQLPFCQDYDALASGYPPRICLFLEHNSEHAFYVAC